MDSAQTITNLETENGRFKRFFMSWKAMQTFYRYSRKMITVDGTFLAGPNKGTLLVAVAQDGNEKLVLLAYAIVESENKHSWKYFFDHLDANFGINNNQTILMSDREGGLLSALASSIVKCNCVRHIAKKT